MKKTAIKPIRPEILRKAISGLQDEIKRYNSVPVESVVPCISKGNKKIGHALNVSLPPIITCANCSGCKSFCYDIKAVLQYGNVRSARARNYSVLVRDRKRYFDAIRSACAKRRKNKYFRWHVSGDILDIDYLDNMVKIAKDFPKFRFWTYTKAYNIVNEYVRLNGRESIPANLSIMFSEWRGMPMVNPYGFPEFRVLFDGEAKPEGAPLCNGNCNVCIKNNRCCVSGETTYCHLH